MSFRELRNFTEIMRALGYPRIISMDNFRKPNFELVADILYWMVKLYDNETTISDRVDFESDRIEFLTGIANLLANKARLKLNTKKLYASDGRAVQEMLKLASLLYKATVKGSSGTMDDDITPPPPIKVQEVKAARVLASEITQGGAKLSDCLAHETQDKSERAKAIRFLDSAGASSENSREHAFIERSIRELIDRTRQTVEDMKKETEELTADERNIEAKIRKKQEELERTEKRLRSLESVRPQFMDEVERLEKELQRHYDVYVPSDFHLRFCNWTCTRSTLHPNPKLTNFILFITSTLHRLHPRLL
jgi:clusterin-associated protein 1